MLINAAIRGRPTQLIWHLVFVKCKFYLADLGLGELGHCLGALGDGMLGKLTGKHKADGGLDIAAAHGRALVHAAKLGCLRGDLLEGVLNKIVDDGHALLGDARLGVHLLHDLEDISLVRDNSLAALLLHRGRLLGSLLHGRGHCEM